MFGKVMSISDELMWRYYELLTDVTMADIERMKRDIAGGAAHPMKLQAGAGQAHRRRLPLARGGGTGSRRLVAHVPER